MPSGGHKPDPSSSGSNNSPNPPSPTEHHTERRKESGKRRRNPLSCAECRRLKLRCDRVFPCESCKKRGCSAICPEGALTTKGTRFVLANTEELHAKIVDMSERIRQLEDALAASHPSGSHPLLSDNLLLVKVPIEFKNDTTESKSAQKTSQPEERPEEQDNFPGMMTAFGTLKIGQDGYSRFFGQTARTEHFLEDDKEAVLLEISKVKNTLPTEILQICQAFPYGALSEDNRLTELILSYLPPLHEAWSLAENYYSHASFMYVPCQKEYFTDQVFNHVYEHINDPDNTSKHRLALVFVVLAHGALTDLNREPYSPFAEQLQLLSRASLAMTPLLAEPSIFAIQTLHLLALYSALSNKPTGGPIGWVIQGLNVKLAEALGLHRDLEYWGAEDQDKSQIEVRRWVFWEMITLEGWLCLGLGRPPTLHFSQIDCKLPAATQRAMAAPDASTHTWHTWKHGLAMFVNRVLQKSLDAKTPPYSEILELDRNIHKYAAPPDVDAIMKGQPVTLPTPEQEPGLSMTRALLLTARYTAVLLLHRGFFAQALSERNDPMQSKYAPSVLATYRSASFVIMALYNAYSTHPELTCRFGLYWSNAFSASIALCLLVTRATTSSYAPLALEHLDLACDMIREAAPRCYPASKALPMATKLYEKAHAAFAPYGDGQHPTSVAPRRATEDDDEELNVLGGKTNVVSDKLAQLRVPRTSLTYPDSPGMPLQMPPTSHLESVHPSLVQYVSESHWVTDMPSNEHLNQTYAPGSLPLLPAQQRPQQTSSYQHPQQQQLYSGAAGMPTQQNYQTYDTYPPGANLQPAASSLADALPPNPQYAYYDHPYPAEGLAGPGQPDINQNQHVTWQNYVQQLYK